VKIVGSLGSKSDIIVSSVSVTQMLQIPLSATAVTRPFDRATNRHCALS
jgi:hypothetical protein